MNEIDLKFNKTIFFLSIEKKNRITVLTEMIIDSLGVYLQYTLINSRSGKSATVRESNHGSGVCKEHNA